MKKTLAIILLFGLILCNTASVADTGFGYIPGEYTSKAVGFGGYVTSTVVIGEDGKISDVKVSGPEETPYVGGYALDEVPGWIIEAQSTEVDAYAGATFTYDAIIASVSDCLSQAAPAEAVPTLGYVPGEYTAKAVGFGGYVSSIVTIDDAGKIADVKVSGSEETPYVGGYALDEVPGWIVEAQGTNVDAYTGATFTYDAIIASVNDCLAQATPAEGTSLIIGYTPGVYTAKAVGFGGYVSSTVTIGEDGKITDIQVSGSEETPYVGGYALDEVPGWIIDAQSTEVDAYAGATFTYDAIIASVNDCLSQAQ